jgi:hypothetical protein
VGERWRGQVDFSNEQLELVYWSSHWLFISATDITPSPTSAGAEWALRAH